MILGHCLFVPMRRGFYEVRTAWDYVVEEMG